MDVAFLNVPNLSELSPFSFNVRVSPITEHSSTRTFGFLQLKPER